MIFENYRKKIKTQQLRILAISAVVLVGILLVKLGGGYGIINIAPDMLLVISTLETTAGILMLASLFLTLSTPLIDSLLSYLRPTSRNKVLSAFNYGVWIITIFFIVAQFTGHLQSIGISLGVFSAGLAIALQQPITSLVGWMVIVSKNTYTVGDRIVLKGLKGDVDEITPFHTVIREVGGDAGGYSPTGVKITLPNNIVLTEAVMNYSSDFPYIWDHIPIAITYESDIEAARQIVKDATSNVLKDSMKKAVEKMRPFVFGTPQELDLDEEPIILTSFSDSSVILKVRYLVKFDRMEKVKSEICEQVLKGTMADPSVTIAYPHTEVVFHDESIQGTFKDFLKRG